MSKKLKCAVACAMAAAVVTWSIEVRAASRTFVATTGADGNTATNCGPTAPCRTFNAALSVTDAGGEVVVLNSGGYGPAPITIAHSVTITAPSGVYAGISVGAGLDGIVVNAPSSNVVLRGLTINGAGGNNGIVMLAGFSLSVEGCVISNFSLGTLNTPVSGAGIYVASSYSAANISDTTVSDNAVGIWADGTSTTNVMNSKALNNQYGFVALPTAAGLTTVLLVTDSTAAFNATAGIWAAGDYLPSVTASAFVEITRVVSIHSMMGFYNGAASTLIISGSTAIGNGYAFYNDSQAIGFTSAGDNKLSDNAIPKFGTITVTPSLLTN